MLAPSGGGLILYQAYGNFYAMTGSTIPRLQEVEDLQGDDLLYYDAEMELMNMILLAIPNEIYNSVDLLGL
ncbi:hypothetical protein Tco_1457659 [Tanacetum coccineum]